jgi:hypothetical protein
MENIEGRSCLPRVGCVRVNQSHVIYDLATNNCQQYTDGRDLLGRNREQIAIEQNEVSELASLE